MIRNSLFLFFSFLFFVSCNNVKKEQLKVAATAVPQGEMLEYIRPYLKKDGVNLKIFTVDDLNQPNRALSEGDISANFFQHIPFLEYQIKEFGYKIKPLAKIIMAPMGVYSDKFSSIQEIRDRSKVAVPNDPTNEARALFLLQKAGLIELNTKDLSATTLNIEKNPKSLEFYEVDAAFLPRALVDVDLAVINAPFALQIGLNPLKDALLLEAVDSIYASVLVVRDEEENKPKIQKLKKALTSEKMRQFILEKYQGAIIPVF